MTSEIKVDTISEQTSANGVAIDGLTIKDGGITATTGSIVFNEASADVDFRVESNGNANMLFVDGGNDRIGVGTGTPTQVLEINVDSSSAIPTSEAIGSTNADVANGLGIHNASDSGVYSGIALETRTSGASRWLIANEWQSTYNGDLVFRNRNGASSSTEVMRLTSGGIAIGGTGSANTLDDYEEGTYAPVFTVASGSLTPHGSHNALAYTKIGRVVHVQGEVRFSAVSSPSGNFSVSLPFAVADLTDGAARSTSGAIGQSGFGGTPDATYYLRITSEGTTTAFFATHNSGSDTGVNANQVSTSTEMILSFTFIAA